MVFKMGLWRRLLAGVLVVVALYLVLGLITARHGDRALYTTSSPGKAGTVTIYVLDNGFHTDLALPADQVMKHGGVLAQAGRAADGQAWIIYGWGDLGFYTAKGFSVARAFDGLRALFSPGNPSVIRIFGSDRRPDEAYTGTRTIVLSQAGFDALAAHMDGSFTTMAGAPVAAPVVTDEAFFLSREHFSILRLCNNWTADQLAAAGLKTAPMLDGLAPLLALDLRWRNGVR